MSYGDVSIRIVFQSERLNEAILNDIANFALNFYEYQGDYNGAKTAKQAISNIISDTFIRLREGGSSISSKQINFGWFELVFSLGNENDGISLSLNRGVLNPDEEIGRRIGEHRLKLNDIYTLSNFLISFSKFAWERASGGLYAAGDWDHIFVPLEKESHREQLINPKDFLGCFWLNIIPEKHPVPEKFAEMPFYGQKPEFKHKWYRNEKIANGTLLVKSLLPLSAINETIESVDWVRLEKHWHQLEKDKGLR